jgi:hypothetical protein
MNIKRIIREEIDDFEWISEVKPMEFPPKDTMWTVHNISEVKVEVLEHLVKGGWSHLNFDAGYDELESVQAAFCSDVERKSLSWCGTNCPPEEIYDIAKNESPYCNWVSDTFYILEWVGNGFHVLHELPLSD